MKKYIEIEADTNDGDYVTNRTEITDEQLILIQPIIDALRLDGDYTTQDQGNSGEEKYMEFEGFKIFDKAVPCPEYGIHTIESIIILEVSNETKLL